MQKLWRVSNGKYTTDYIRADSLDEAQAIFEQKHLDHAVEFQVEDSPIQAIYFTDNPSPAYFKGNKQDARKAGRLYIRQWNLDATIDRIETI
jgi:hypothetical protein